MPRTPMTGRWLFGTIALLWVVSIAIPALAHADLVSETPANGAVVSEPVERFELVFTAAVEPVESGMRLLHGNHTMDITVFQPSEDTVVVELVEPISSGRYALFWKVQSADAHVIEGTTVGEVAVPADSAQDGSSSQSTVATAEGATPAAPTTTIASEEPLIIVNTSLPPRAFEVAAAAVAQDATVGRWMSAVGRWILMAGGLLAIGALVFAGTSLAGTEDEVRRAVRWVRRGGALVLVGTLIEAVGVSTTLAGSLADALAFSNLVDVLAGAFGVSVLLRLAGGIALLADPRLAASVPVGGASVEGGGADVSASDTSTESGAVMTEVPAMRYRLDLKQEWVLIAGALAFAASFAFDGHTATVGPSVVAKASSFVHVLAGGVWFGGLVVLADTLTRRSRSGIPLDAGATVLRFSRSASVALGVVALAGLALAWTILGSPSDLVSTTWGLLLLAKVGLVAVVVGLGAYNHFKLVPDLANDPRDEATSARLRRIVLAEAAGLAGVIAFTAILVGVAA